MPIRVCLVGAGRMGTLRGGIMARSARFDVVVLVDPWEGASKLADELGARHGKARPQQRPFSPAPPNRLGGREPAN